MFRKIWVLFFVMSFLFNFVLQANGLDIDSGIHYKSFRNGLADLMGGFTTVKIVKNKNGEKEFVIDNEKHHAVMIEFRDSHAKKFAEYVAMPNTATILDKSLELLETPLKVDYKSYFDGTFLSSMTNTGLIEKNLPRSGSIKIYLGNKKAMVVTAIGIFASSLDFGLSYAELASGKSVSGLKKYIQYIFFYDAIRNPELINACVTILTNLPSNPSTKQIETALIQIKDEYMKYLDGNFKAILSKYLYALLDFKTTDAFERGLKLTMAQVKNLALIEKFGKNILVPLSALTADIVKGERTIGWQFFYDGNGANYPKIAKDIPLSYALNNKLFFLASNNIRTVYNLYNTDAYITFNPEKPIKTEDFINLILEVYNRTHLYNSKLSTDIFYPLSDKLYVNGSSIKFKDTIALKDAIAVMYYLFEKSYGLEFRKGKIYRKGTMKAYSKILFKYFTKNHYKAIKNQYGSFYLAKTRLIYMIYGTTLFRNSSELNNKLTKAKAINLIYDYMKYHSVRDKGE